MITFDNGLHIGPIKHGSRGDQNRLVNNINGHILQFFVPNENMFPFNNQPNTD